ncbi:MAG: hypothetical protein HC800_00790 [Phormidesmis sp. RL_2_1]|nr:hypothetical protein [Phormidesmis sp. RL_2_1]
MGQYGFEPDLKNQEDIWINWQVAGRTFEIQAKVTSRRKEVYVDGKNVVLNMSDREKTQFSAIYPNGLEALL